MTASKVTVLAVRPGRSNTVAAGLSDGTIAVRTLPLGGDRCRNEFQLCGQQGHAISGLCWSPDGERLISCSAQSDVRVWNLGHSPLADGELPFCSGQGGVVWVGDNSIVFVDYWNCLTRLELDTGNHKRMSVGGPPCSTITAAGSLFAVGRKGGDVEIFNAGTGQAQSCFSRVVDGRPVVRFLRDQTVLCVGGDDGRLVLFDVARPAQQPAVLHGHEKTIVSIDTTDTRVASSAMDLTTRVWDARSTLCLRVFDMFSLSIAFCAFDTSLLCTTAAGEQAVWPLVHWTPQRHSMLLSQQQIRNMFAALYVIGAAAELLSQIAQLVHDNLVTREEL